MKPNNENYQLIRNTAGAIDLELLPATISWFNSLPAIVRPYKLAEKYPRIANHLAANWKSAEKIDAYMQELMVDERGGRQGFPISILNELADLKNYFAKGRHLSGTDIWGLAGISSSDKRPRTLK